MIDTTEERVRFEAWSNRNRNARERSALFRQLDHCSTMKARQNINARIAKRDATTNEGEKDGNAG